MKNHYFFVCNSFSYDRIRLNFFAENMKYNSFTKYVYSNAEWYVCRVFFWKHEISTVPGTSKNWKIHEFFWIFSFVPVLFSNSKIVRRTRFCRFYSDLMREKYIFWWFRIEKQLSDEKICILLCITLWPMIRLSLILLQKT